MLQDPIELDFSADLKTLLSESIVVKVKNYQQIVAECDAPQAVCTRPTDVFESAGVSFL